MKKLKLAVVVGSTRDGRFAEKPAAWIAELARAHGGFEVEVLDLKDYPMGYYGDPATSEAENETAARWKDKVRGFDAYVMTVAEYNHAPTAVLKNAIDHGEWIRKPVGFVAYGGVGGARAVEQVRQIAVEMQLASVKSAVHILWPDYLPVAKGEKSLADLPHLAEAAGAMLDQLGWWGRALASARQADDAAALAKAS